MSIDTRLYKQSWKAWLLAARPKTLTASLAPIMVATFLALRDTGSVAWMLSLYALLGSLCVQVATNLINDAVDFKKGADTETRLGPTRVTQQGLLTSKQVLAGGTLFFLLAAVFTVPLVLKAGWIIAVIFSVSVFCGYFYTAGPYPLAYNGLGDVFVVLFFGIVSTATFYYVQTLHFSWMALLAGLQVGLLCAVMIAINNLRDRLEDAKVNKNTLAVRFGEKFSKIEVACLVYIPFLLGPIWFFYGYIYAALLPWITIFLGNKIVRSVIAHEPGEIYNVFLGFAALLHLLFSVLLCVGLSM